MSSWIKNSEIKEKFGTSYDSLRKYRAALEEGNVAILFENKGYRAKSELDPYTDVIKEDFNSKPPKTLREAQDRIEKMTGLIMIRWQVICINLPLSAFGRNTGVCENAKQDMS